MKKYEFDALILKHEDIDATFIEFPYDVEKEFVVKPGFPVLKRRWRC